MIKFTEKQMAAMLASMADSKSSVSPEEEYFGVRVQYDYEGDLEIVGATEPQDTKVNPNFKDLADRYSKIQVKPVGEILIKNWSKTLFERQGPVVFSMIEASLENLEKNAGEFQTITGVKGRAGTIIFPFAIKILGKDGKPIVNAQGKPVVTNERRFVLFTSESVSGFIRREYAQVIANKTMMLEEFAIPTPGAAPSADN